MMSNPMVHWEFWSKEPSKVSDFYSKVYDWKIQHIPEMDYRMVDASGEGGLTGGIMTPKDGPWPGNMSFYIDVDSLAVYRKKLWRRVARSSWKKWKSPVWGNYQCFRTPTSASSASGKNLRRAGNSNRRSEDEYAPGYTRKEHRDENPPGAV